VLTHWLTVVVVLCDICNRNRGSDNVLGIAILDTTAIPELHMKR